MNVSVHDRFRPGFVSFLFQLFALVVAILIGGCARHAATSSGLTDSCHRCNIILISLDTLRADHLGAYGYQRETSPNFDRLAARGLLFERAYPQATWTLPSHVSILTGLYPTRHQTVCVRSRIPRAIEQIPQYLRKAGYDTAAFTGGGFVKQSWGYRGFEDFWSIPGVNFAWAKYWDTAHRAAAWIRLAHRPFFLFFHTYGTHAPYIPDKKFDLFSEPSYHGPVDTRPGKNTEVCGQHPRSGCLNKQAGYFAMLNRLGVLHTHDIQYLVEKYDGEVREVDDVVGFLLKALSRANVLNHSIVIITSDHGEMLGDRVDGHRLFGHPHPYEAGVHVPLLIWWPGVKARRIPEIVESIDILPTALDIAGIEPLPDIDGRSLVRNGKLFPRRYAITEGWRVKEHDQISLTVTTKKWQMTRWNNGRKSPIELFDLDHNPTQLASVAGNHPQIVSALQRSMDEWRRALGRRFFATPDHHGLRALMRKQLKALGYL